MQDLNENLLILGYISDKLGKTIQECCVLVKKCFFSKFQILDLVSEVNTKRVFSILKSLVELYHICKFFKDEGIFNEGKYQKNNQIKNNEESDSFDLSDFITNYLNKTYKRVIKHSISNEI